MKRTRQTVWSPPAKKLHIAKWLAACGLHATRSANRGGTTLTEVLVSLMVMSIGVVSLTSIFPLSLARSIRAAQLTSATICRYNCEAMLDADRSILMSIPASSKAVIDPLGANVLGADRPAFANVFGNDGTAAVGSLTRMNGGRNTMSSADFLVTLPDSWTVLHDGTAVNPVATQIRVTGLSALLPALPGNLVKVTMFYEGAGRLLSISRTATGLSGDDVTWTDAIPTPILTGWGANPVKVRVEQQNRNYTWLATANRNASDQVAIDVAVFYRRSFSAEDERVHTANLTTGQRNVTITFSGIEPSLKKGSYLFDPVNVQWYRISDIKSKTSTNAQLELDRPAAFASTRSIFMKGIVEVYRIDNTKGISL